MNTLGSRINKHLAIPLVTQHIVANNLANIIVIGGISIEVPHLLLNPLLKSLSISCRLLQLFSPNTTFRNLAPRTGAKSIPSKPLVLSNRIVVLGRIKTSLVHLASGLSRVLELVLTTFALISNPRPNRIKVPITLTILGVLWHSNLIPSPRLLMVAHGAGK